MESLMQSFAILLISLSILLFFGPVVVIVSIIGNVKLGPVKIDLTGKSTTVRVLLAIIGLGSWFLLYIPLVSLAFRAVPFLNQDNLTHTPIPNTPTTTAQLITVTPSNSPTSTNEPSPTQTIQPTIESTISPTSTYPTAEMVRVPGGTFIMGSGYSTPRDYNPAHTVYVNEFFIDKYEVTNGQYARCVQAGVCSPPQSFKSNTREHYFDDPSVYGKFPVIFVTWLNAKTYCEWRGARLPTEAEWEKAARWNGPDDPGGNLYPWGDEQPSYNWVNFNGQDTTEVGIFPLGKSEVGAYDMAGNVLEWVYDFYAPEYYQKSPERNPLGPSSSTYGHVARGGAWSSVEDWQLWTFRRFYYQPTNARSDLGFRCASDHAP